MNLNKVQRFSNTPTKLGHISLSQPPKITLSQSVTNKVSQIYKNSPYARPNSRSKSSPHKADPSPARIRRATPTIKKNSSSSLLQTQSIPPQKRTSSHSNLPLLNESIDNFTVIKPNRQGHSVNLSFNNSFKIPSQGNDSKGSPKIPSRQSTASTEIQFLEGKLSQKLSELSQKDRLQTVGKLNVYREIFQEIINKDTIYGTLLAKIQKAYDEALTERNTLKALNTNELESKVEDLNRKLTNCAESKRSLEKKIERVLKENQALNIKLEDKETRYEELQGKLYKISQVNVEGVDMNEESWKFIIAENKAYADLCQKMKTDIKNYKYKEKKLLKLVMALKKRGYPVEEVYDQDVQKKKKEMPKYEGSDEPEDNSENEQLVSGRPKDVKKPQNIPSLKLEEIQHETFSSSSSSSYSESNESSSSSSKA
ncbi:unnamed protein product [Blepharisma stoltei]|uniref:Translin-associated factor X-interacting protein 1 N-terminal domain-containing protein n=1 Tax=Blepharisma stoltei TaxID=1481888 RepID=A0AAU9IEF2_9CILI|nr:unnamed protein product [Blepharisma stoltei]